MESVEIHVFKEGLEALQTIIYPNKDGKFTIDEAFDLNAEFQVIINKGE